MDGKCVYRYPGSRPFEDTDIDRRLFFGRELEKEELLQKIIARKLVVLHAVSGLGKTSLLNAGVSELLRERGFIPIKIRFNMAETDPIQNIFNGIEEMGTQHDLDIEPGETETLWHYFKTAVFWSSDDSLLTPVLILDQFEEFFAFHDPEVRSEFISQLADLVNNTIPQSLWQAIRAGVPYRYDEEPPMVKIVISIRSDYVGQLDELSFAIPEILENRYRLLALTRIQAREAITMPAQIEDENMITQRFGYSEDALNTMLDYLSKRQERGGVVNKDEVESFQLQLLCLHIETNIREKASATVGKDELEVKKEDLGGEEGMHKVFQNFYEDRLADLKPALKKRRVRRLCEKGLISDSDRRLSLEEEDIEKRFKVSSSILAQLVDNRLLRAEKRVGSVYYELSHDTLITPIRLSQRKRMDTLFKEAEQLTFDAKNDQSIGKYYEILEEDPKNIMTIVKLGELLNAVGKYEQAVQFYKIAIDNGVTDARVYDELGKSLFKIGKEEEAIKYINIAIEKYKSVLAINIKKKEVYEKLAVLYVEKGEKEKAIDVFKRALMVDIEFVWIYQKIRDVLQQKNDTETLETLYGIALKVESKDIYHYFCLGDDYSKLKKYDAAIASYQKALKLKPDFTEAYHNIGFAQSGKGDYNAAIASYQKSLELKPDFAEAYYNMGIAQYNEGAYDGAIASYKKALELKPDYAKAYYNMGVTFSIKGVYDAAISSYQKTLELKPDFTDAYSAMGFAQNKKGAYDLAIANCKKALELKPDVANLYNTMGIAQKNEGDYDVALASFQKALEIEPTFLFAKANLADLYLITEHFDQTVELARLVLNTKDLPPDGILAMMSIVISSLFFQDNQNQALLELNQFITYYKGLTNEYKRDWDYRSTKKFITQAQRLSEPTRALLLKMIDLLEAPLKDRNKILVELEKMIEEYK